MLSISIHQLRDLQLIIIFFQTQTENFAFSFFPIFSPVNQDAKRHFDNFEKLEHVVFFAFWKSSIFSSQAF